MDYEQKYKDALERAKSFELPEYKNIMASIFPELKEPDDERIRKALIELIIDYPDLEMYENYDININDALAWLEKQKGTNVFDVPKISIKDAIEVTSRMQYIEDDMKPIADFVIDYANWDLHKDEWNQPTLTVPLFRVLDALIQRGKPYCECGQNSEKQGEQNPTDKVEPKFKVGDWVTNGDYTWKIVEVKPLDYILQSQDGNMVDDTISYVDEQFHSFTIQDAKDGDVLVYNNNSVEIILLFKKWMNGVGDGAYSYAHTFDNKILFDDWSDCGYATHPATKEQRDLLFKKMHEAGYEWDEGNKELKKIEQNSAWSEEDKEMIDKIIDYMQPMPIFFESTKGKSGKEYTKKFIKDATKWLKSLKQRYTWKPSDEQIKALKETCDEHWEPDGLDPLYTLWEQLKKLKENKLWK